MACPAAISVAVRSWRGPLGRSGTLGLPVQRLAFANTGPDPVTVAGFSVDPLQQAERGVMTGKAALRIEAERATTVAAGASLVLALGGTVPGRPGTYLSALRLRVGSGPALAIPVRVAVAASAAWGVGLTLLGLSVVSAMSGLDAQGTVAAKLREALHRRGEAQAFVEQHAVGEGRGEVAAMDRAYEAAITALSRPRSAGLIDHRLEDAAAPLAEADAAAAALRQAAAGQSAGDAVVATAALPWQALEPQLRALSAAPAAAAAGEMRPADADPIAPRLEAVLARLRDRLVGAPARWLAAELGTQMADLRLIAASGELEEARAQAAAVRLAMRRAARNLARGQRLVMRERTQMAFLLGTIAAVQQGEADPALAPETRADLAGRLAAARAMLADGVEPERLVPLNHAVNEAATALTRAQLEAEHNRVAAAVAAASAETEFPEVDAAVATAQADPDRSPATKAAHLRAILEAWRAMIGRARVASARPALLARVEAVAAALERGDMSAVGTQYAALTTAWAAYANTRIDEAGASALKPYCDGYAAQLQRQLGYLDQALRWEDPDARSVAWDRRRDRLRLTLDRIAPNGDCLAALLAVDKDINGLAAEIGAAGADTAGVAASVRAEALALAGAPAGAGPRVLVPRAAASAAGLVVDRPLPIVVGNLDPDWGAGTAVSVGFGDDSPAWRGDVETLRQNPPTHSYARPLTAHVTVLAADALTPEGQAVGAPLGEGTATLLIAPAPDSRARTLADRFLSARFGLALIVALALYSWRFQARDRVFGARGFDYAEAFALGFAVNAAIGELPTGLGKLALP